VRGRSFPRVFSAVFQCPDFWKSYHFDPLVKGMVRYAPEKTVLDTVFEGYVVPRGTTAAQALLSFLTSFGTAVRTTVRLQLFGLYNRTTRQSCFLAVVGKHVIAPFDDHELVFHETLQGACDLGFVGLAIRCKPATRLSEIGKRLA
jgi:hypothetical protein